MRLIIVSNRLPVTVLPKQKEFEFKHSVGGVATGILTYLQSYAKDMEYVWVGWPGTDIEQQYREKIALRLLQEYHAHPVYISEKVMNKFYLGFCNKTIWPIFHYFPTLAHYQDDFWDAYEEVNTEFCSALEKIVKPGDIIWVHDYHFMLLPEMLKRKFPQSSIGFFLHIPFPSFEIYRLLPPSWRTRILEGILGADLIGFHTHDYSQHFLRCVLRLLGKEHTTGNILLQDRQVKVDTFPMGIDYAKYNQAPLSENVKKEIKTFNSVFAGRKVILSIDRLDYTKGIMNRLLGYEQFLETHPAWHEKVMLVAVVVPSRIGVDKYQDMKRNVEELISKINGKLGRFHWTPILYQYKALDFDTLTALYASSHIAIVTPLRDGMNLIAKEFIATHADRQGVLILSEMAGAVKELGEAIIINPNDTDAISHAIAHALEMPLTEQINKNTVMQKRLERYDVKKWSEDFLFKLMEIKKEQETLCANYLTAHVRKDLLKKYGEVKKRLFFLDYDGTLAPFSERPELAYPSQEVKTILKSLSKDEKNCVVLISGRTKDTLEKWFGDLNINLVAEHGVWKRTPHEGWTMYLGLDNSWKEQFRSLFELHTDRLPGSLIEEKEFSIAWHYRLADSEHSDIIVKELIDDLVMYTANLDLQVLRGNKVVELRNYGINKGTAAMEWLSQGNWDYILAMGDDFTDEDLFQKLPDTSYTIKIGLGQSRARFNLHTDKEARQLLTQLINSHA